MPDDPREILRTAGVECAEVEKMYADYFFFHKRSVPWSAMDAILALARLVAKYKWQRDEYGTEIRRCYEALHAEFGNWPPDAADEFFADLDRRWEKRDV